MFIQTTLNMIEGDVSMFSTVMFLEEKRLVAKRFEATVVFAASTVSTSG